MFISTSALMTLSQLERKGMTPSYMAIKKALYGRQPSSIYFFGFVFVALKT
jgi:hypothetical protein